MIGMFQMTTVGWGLGNNHEYKYLASLLHEGVGVGHWMVVILRSMIYSRLDKMGGMYGK